MDLKDLGWSPLFSRHVEFHELGYTPARISSHHRNLYRALTEAGELVCNVSGRLRNEAVTTADLPVVGDWVLLQPRELSRGTIRRVLPRNTKLSRRAAGTRNEEQIIAANVDTMFIVNALDHDFSLRRMERYLSLAAEAGIEAVLLLNKSDVCAEAESKRVAAQAISKAVAVHSVSAHTGDGLPQLQQYFKRGCTIAFVGSSGVGKSTLINALFGASVQATSPVREADSKGRHTTTYRRLIPTPGGALLLDTPGMRELQLWAENEALDIAFADITQTARLCRFRDCTHRHEPGCAVRGSIDPARLESFHKQQKELAYLHRRRDVSAAQAEKQKWKAIHKSVRNYKKGE